MKIVQYKKGDMVHNGLSTSRGIVELADVAGPTDLAGLLAPAKVMALAAAAESATNLTDPDTVELLAPIAPGARIFCVGLNYHDHVQETKRELPPVPSIFMRTRESYVGHGGKLLRSHLSEQFDFEGELGVVIGRAGRYIDEARAMEHVGGYTCCDDGSVRDYQRQSTTVGKCFDASGAIGPHIVTADEIADLDTLTLVTRLNGKEVQRATLDQMIYRVPTIISYVSRFTELRPGDIISTGTPAGVGSRREPPLWMKDGDILEIDISSIGVLRATVVDQVAPK